MKHTAVAGPLLIGLVLLATPATAQTGTVRGRVVTEQGAPVAKAKVLITSQGGMTDRYEIQTNDNGEYLQVGLRPGPYRITASAEGYRPSVIDMRVALGDPTEVLDIRLKLVPPPVKDEATVLREKFAKAVEFSDAGEFDQAEALYKEILETQPDIAEAYQNLGYLYEQKEDWAAAQSAYEKALELRPDSSEITTALALVYQQTGQSQKATDLMARAAAENPLDAVAQFNRGGLLLNSGDTAGAIQSFEAALAADPDMAEAHYYLGTVLVGQGRTPEAIEHLEKYLSMNPDREQHVATAEGLLQALKK
jgi:tetratricopeptide (TPR) repeat protein